MESSSSNDDDEPKVCTVFASSDSSKSKTVFDTIAFSIPKKDTSPTSPFQPTLTSDLAGPDQEPVPSSTLFSAPGGDPSLNQSGDLFSSPDADADASSTFNPTSLGSYNPMDIFEEHEQGGDFTRSNQPNDAATTVQFISNDSIKEIAQTMEGVSLDADLSQTAPGQGQGEGLAAPLDEAIVEEVEDGVIPTANMLFANAPDVPFPVGAFEHVSSIPASTQGGGVFAPTINEPPSLPTSHLQPSVQPKLEAVDAFSSLTYSPIDASYDAWIPKVETRRILLSIATAIHSGTYFPDKSHMTTPGIMYEDDLLDKVGVNVSRIFGEVEANKRRILTADSVTQDDCGLRELIKLGCYRSAINLTKRLLTFYGQGPGKVGQFSKHNPLSLQLWFTRISLLVRIREFTIAESEIEAFKDFDNPDLYYEYYPDSYGGNRKGSMVPFHFRLLAAEILQYSRKHNETIYSLTKIQRTVEQILININEGVSEDGSGITIDGVRKSAALEIWLQRQNRVLYSLANASLFAKDYRNTFKYLELLSEKDETRAPQLKSAIGRLFLQIGDLTTASSYFKIAAGLRNGGSESDNVENLVDSAMISIAQGTYPDALALLQQASNIQPDNFMITNNMSVCLLYMGKVKESLALMETTVKNNTPQLLQENVMLNLSTIYELENTDGHKKNGLLKLIGEYKGDGINLASLKMPNLI